MIVLRDAGQNEYPLKTSKTEDFNVFPPKSFQIFRIASHSWQSGHYFLLL